MPWRVLAFALGIWLLQQRAVLPAPTFLAAMAVAGSLLWLAGRQRRRWLSCRCRLLGLAWAGGFAHWRLVDALPVEWEGRDIEITGVIADLPQRFEHGVRFTVAVEQAAAPVPRRIALTWYRQFDAVRMTKTDGRIRCAQWTATAACRGALALSGASETTAWQSQSARFRLRGLAVRARHPRHGLRQNVGADGRLDSNAGGLSGTIERLREAMRARISRTLPDHPYAGVLTALAIGDQRAIDAGTLARLRRHRHHPPDVDLRPARHHGRRSRGLAGVLALAPLAAPAAALPAQKAAARGRLRRAFGYACSPASPCRRSARSTCSVVVAVALWPGARRHPAVLALALLLVLLLDPWAVFAAGFWLSFGAVALLFYIGRAASRRRHWLVAMGPRAMGDHTRHDPRAAGAVPAVFAGLAAGQCRRHPGGELRRDAAGAAGGGLARGGSAAVLAHWLLTGLMTLLEWLAGCRWARVAAACAAGLGGAAGAAGTPGCCCRAVFPRAG